VRIVATVTGTTKVTNVASRLAGTPPDFDPGNNTSRASVTGSTVPGLPNTGTPPVGSWWPALLALLVVLAIVPWRRRRPQPEADRDQAGS
jgi:MYXO-CTERM domain-containing protein